MTVDYSLVLLVCHNLKKAGINEDHNTTQIINRYEDGVEKLNKQKMMLRKSPPALLCPERPRSIVLSKNLILPATMRKEKRYI